MPAIRDLLYVRFEIEDLDKQAQFLTDFGFQVTQEKIAFLLEATIARPTFMLPSKRGVQQSS